MKIPYRSVLLFSILTLGVPPLASAELSVIVHPGNNSSISADDIKRIFLGKLKRYPEGLLVVAINQKTSNPIRKSFDKNALGKSGSQVKAYWSKLVFSGKGNPPKEVATDKEMIELVKDNPSIIGYVDSNNVSADVKVVVQY